MVICLVHDNNVLVVLYRASCFIQIDIQHAISVFGRTQFRIGIIGQINRPGYISALKTVLIQPTAASAYEDIIALMDEFKKSDLTDLGVAPL